jgi:3-hydroxybutyryl-CoA dehydrogenase
MFFSFDPHSSVGVIGAGSMGAGIAQLAAQAGHEVRLHDLQPGATATALQRIGADLDGAVRRGKMDAAERDAVLARLSVADTLEALAGCGLVVEAIVERLDAKQQLFRALEGVVGADAVLATNTSSISITAVAQGLAHPERFAGLHFFNPPTRMKLVEVIAGVATDPALPPALQALAKAWGKTPVNAPNAPGFIVNRVARPYYAEALRLAAEGLAAPATIDALMTGAGGFALGPFELMDLIGLDVNLAVTESVFQATGYDPRYAPHLLQQELVRAGRYGRKTKRGFHDYSDGAAPREVATVSPGEAPREPLGCAAQAGLLGPLIERLRAAGVAIETRADLAAETVSMGELRIALTDGRTTAERASIDRTQAGSAAALLLLDLAHDYATATHLGAATDRRGAAALPTFAAVLSKANIRLIPLDDVAGLGVMRTVCCLANEAADVMTWTGTTAADIDTAMRLGTAYPSGPLGWADRLGATRVATVLAHLQAHYGEVRYRRAPALSRAVHAATPLHG